MWNLPILKNIDLSLCTGLEALDIREVPLANLNVLNNDNLKYIDLYKLKLDVIYLSNNLEISEILIDYDALKKIMISGNNKIQRIR